MTDAIGDISFFEDAPVGDNPHIDKAIIDELAPKWEAVVTPSPEPETDKEAHDHEQPEVGYVAPDSNAENVFKSLTNALRRGLKPGMSVMKGVDGKRYMLIVTSNSYQDREGETLTTPALKEWVDTCWKSVEDEFATDNPLVYWHDMRVKMGDIVWSDMRGPFLVELAVESEGVLARKMFDYVAAHPEEKWGASHKFAYFKAHKEADGTYHRIVKKETTVLPRSAAANALTFSGVIPMASKRDSYLNKMLGLENAAELLDKGIDTLVAELNKQGIDHKGLEKPVADEITKSFGGLVSSLIDAQVELDERLEAVNTELATVKEARLEAEKSAGEAATAQAAKIEAQAAELATLKAKLETLTAAVEARPKSASQAAETQVSATEIPDSIKNAMKETDKFWGTEVGPT